MEEMKVINIIIQIAIAIVISAGGISGIILAIIKFIQIFQMTKIAVLS